MHPLALIVCIHMWQPDVYTIISSFHHIPYLATYNEGETTVFKTSYACMGLFKPQIPNSVSTPPHNKTICCCYYVTADVNVSSIRTAASELMMPGAFVSSARLQTDVECQDLTGAPSPRPRSIAK